VAEKAMPCRLDGHVDGDRRGSRTQLTHGVHSLVRAVWNDGERLARLSKKPAKEVPLFHGLLRVEAVLEHSVALPPWSAAARSVEAADSPAPHGRSFAAGRLDTWEVSRSFLLVADSIWETTCPACSSKAFLAGVKYSEEVSEDQEDNYPDEERVDIFLVAEEFRCPSCGLHLESRDAIEAAELEVEHTETEVRQREYEPDYGND
jgi:hypothetical protein